MNEGTCVLRGGACNNKLQNTRSAVRLRYPAVGRVYCLGFRVAMDCSTSELLESLDKRIADLQVARRELLSDED